MALPNLLYLSDVPVEASYHGSALLHRLLGAWPRKQLMLVEPGFSLSRPERRLPDVPYRRLHFGIPRLIHSRLSTAYGSFILLTAKGRQCALRRVVGAFQAEAVLTVVHGYSWLAAAAFALDQGLPLHLICHDDWLAGVRMLPVLRPRAEVCLKEHYRRARSRLCISPYMAAKYALSYGAAATVLYPSRALDCPQHSLPPARIAHALARPACAFAGTINGGAYVQALQGVARALETVKGRLLIYGPTTAQGVERARLKLPNIEFRGLLRSAQLISQLRDEADILYVPMSFDVRDRPNMELSFPSKLTDYTATGLPMLIHGPPYCSAVRWALENPGVAEVVTEEHSHSLSDALVRLVADGPGRWRLGTTALHAGQRYFSHGVALQIFLRALRTVEN